MGNINAKDIKNIRIEMGELEKRFDKNDTKLEAHAAKLENLEKMIQLCDARTKAYLDKCDADERVAEARAKELTAIGDSVKDLLKLQMNDNTEKRNSYHRYQLRDDGLCSGIQPQDSLEGIRRQLQRYDVYSPDVGA